MCTYIHAHLYNSLTEFLLQAVIRGRKTLLKCDDIVTLLQGMIGARLVGFFVWIFKVAIIAHVLCQFLSPYFNNCM